jgi:hypothetical protein
MLLKFLQQGPSPFKEEVYNRASTLVNKLKYKQGAFQGSNL